MWETSPPDTAANAVGDGQEVLTPAAIERVLADFRSWLQELSGAASAVQPVEEQTPPIDLHTLLGQFVALRHDVNLQTRAARSQQELTGQALEQLNQALEALGQAQNDARQGIEQTQDEALRPLLKTLLDVHDAFSLAEREIRRTREIIAPLVDELNYQMLPWDDADCEPEPAVPERAPAPEPKSSLWQRLFGRQRNQDGAEASEAFAAQQQQLNEQHQRLLSKQHEQQEKIEHLSERLDQFIDSVVTGYRMSLQRLEHAFQDAGLEPIPCVGQPFDPEQMEVVAAVADSGCPAGEVIEEVRRGYLWHGRVFRYAQVSVAKS